MKYSKGSFITIPNRELLAGINPKAQCLFMWLCFHANQDGQCFPSRAALAKECGIKNLHTLDKNLKILVESGLITKENRIKNNEQQSNLYEIIVGGVGQKMTQPRAKNGITPQGKKRHTELNPSSLTQSREEESQNQNFAPPSNWIKPNTEKGWRDLRRAEQGKPPTRTPRTEKQDKVFAALKWKDYFREQGYTIHGMQFFLVRNEKREKIVSKLIITAHNVVKDKMKEFIDWWFKGNGEWAQYEPEQCFSAKTIERYLNTKDKENDIYDKLLAITKAHSV